MAIGSEVDVDVDVPNLGTQIQAGVSKKPYCDLIAVRAYEKWQWRCRIIGHVVHGGDQEDWLLAEAELDLLYGQLNANDLAAFRARVPSIALEPPRERIELRAYYISRASGAQTREDAERCWRQAEGEERTILFAQAFLQFQSQRHGAPSRARQSVSWN